ncbi:MULTISPECIES: hypothetical protein [unclassified Brevundimonas]|uniref:hypothetical protein n=1 Tax=unclassified Brevundimonas TaxID=2622653 RepID=UPI0025BF22C4|nr:MULTISPECIES: hypothetical protein [unclassified Brevundimonas]
MAKPVLTGLALSLSALALAGCARGGGEQVHTRLASPDGAREAVLMTCSMPGDAKVLLVTGAVFDAKGRGCGDVDDKALASVWVSLPEAGDGPQAQVSWDGDRAVFSFEGDRTVISRQAKAGGRLDLIAVRGEFAEADIVETSE